MKQLLLILLVLILIGSNISTYQELKEHRQFQNEIRELTNKKDKTKSLRNLFLYEDSINTKLNNYIK